VVIYINLFSIREFGLIIAAPALLVSFLIIWRLLYSPIYMMRRLFASIVPLYIVIYISTEKLATAIESLLVKIGVFNEEQNVSEHVSSFLEFLVSFQQAPLFLLLIVGALAFVEMLSHSPILDILKSKNSTLFIQQQTSNEDDPVQKIYKKSGETPKYFLKFQLSVTASAENGTSQLVKSVSKLNKISVSFFWFDWPIIFDNSQETRDFPGVANPAVDLTNRENHSADMRYNISSTSWVLGILLFLKTTFKSKFITFKVSTSDTNGRRYLTPIILAID
tara:strand:+ start:1212 stop:2045 length:834 start_codon:yes stop_codon:yes gene_type:complete